MAGMTLAEMDAWLRARAAHHGPPRPKFRRAIRPSVLCEREDPPTAAPDERCGWNTCRTPAVAWRHHATYGWLPVCVHCGGNEAVKPAVTP